MEVVPNCYPDAKIPYPLISALLCRDTGHNLLKTSLCNKKIACFMIGGELRLCLPQVCFCDKITYNGFYYKTKTKKLLMQFLI